MTGTIVLVCLASDYDFWRPTPGQLRDLQARFPQAAVLSVAADELPSALATADVFLGWRFDPAWFALAPRLRWIASPAAGTDHLPVAEAASAGVVLTRSFGFHGTPVAEHAMGLVLGFSRGLFASYRSQAVKSRWKDEIAEQFFDLDGATMTIVGCGSIGMHLARTAQSFGMNVVGVRRDPPPGPATVTWIPARRLQEALGRARVVVDLLPATPDTVEMFDRDTFAACRPGAVFLNLGRAATVHHPSLLEAVNTGRLSGAALDVQPGGPLPLDDTLRHHPRIVLTPKSAVFCRHYMDHALAFFADNLDCYLTDQPLRGTATPFRATAPSIERGKP
jgi:phosphoglycerate dehydrogenase-like enzyme